MNQPKLRGLRGSADAPLHGGRLRQARRLFPSAPEPFIDLSTGINPLPYPVPPLAPEAWTRLPEPEDIAALEQAAAKAYRVPDAAQIVAVPGTQSLISLLPRLFPQDQVAILSPTYGEYARAFTAAGTRVLEAATLAELASADAAILCNPNNPDGRRFDATALAELVRGRPAGSLLVVDESFCDLEDSGLSLAPRLPLPGVVILRSLSKTYGLGGLRLGFALTGPDFASAIRAALGPWPVSGPAIEIGMQALSDRSWREAAKGRLGQEVTRLDRMLHQAGLVIVGGTLLFRLASSPTAPELFDRLGQAGILVRKFDYARDWLRFGLPGSEDEWQRLAAALA
ncbi:MAG: threonine-phosphate decarboxylase CobD [Methyloceanibacter sp.]